MLYVLIVIATTFSGLVQAKGDFHMTVVNKTNNDAIKHIYILVKGINPDTHNQCFIAFNSPESIGTYVDVTKNTDSAAYAYDYTYFKDAIMRLPNLISGRIYISLNQKLTMPIVGDAIGKLGVADPNPFNPTDSSYPLYFDKIEFTYIDRNTWTNPTAVDFFALPLSIQQNGKEYGLMQPRDEVLKKVIDTFNAVSDKAWQQLIVRNEKGFILRVVAPGRDNNYFDKNYLTNTTYNYVDDVWSYYAKNTIKIDCSELKEDRYAPRLGSYFFEGRVQNGELVFTNETNDHTVKIAKPSSNSFFLGAQGVFEAQNHTPRAVIVRTLSAAWCVGLLPAPSGQLLNRDYFLNNTASFYTTNPFLSEASLTRGPFYNVYGKAFHELSKTIYTWAYDDAFGYDGTNGSTDQNPATLTIWGVPQDSIN